MSTVIQELQEAIDNAIESKLVQVRTSIPGIIRTYDSETGLADVQIAVKRRRKIDNDQIQQEEIPVLQGIPVRQLRAENTWIKLPVAVGSKVNVQFYDRDVDQYRSSGSISETSTSRKHDISDAYCTLDAYEDDNNPNFDSGDAGSLSIYNGQTKIVIGDDGSIKMGKKGASPSNPIVLGNELVSKLNDLLDILIAGKHVLITTPGNPSAPNPDEAAKFLLIKTNINNILSNKLFTRE